MFSDNETAVARVLMQINDLTQSLKGYGVPRVTARGAIDGKSLSDALIALRGQIDEFLSKEE